MLTHKGTMTITTPRLALRPFTPEDAEAMYRNWASDEKVTKYLTWQPHTSTAATKVLLELWCADYEKDDNYNWCITLDGEPIGNISVVRFSERDEEAELGYCLSKRHWGRGFMSEAAGAVIDFLFREVGVHRVSIRHATQNPASGKVAQKCGLTYEGTTRDGFKALWGEWLDIAHYGILRSEWETQ